MGWNVFFMLTIKMDHSVSSQSTIIKMEMIGPSLPGVIASHLIAAGTYPGWAQWLKSKHGMCYHINTVRSFYENIYLSLPSPLGVGSRAWRKPRGENSVKTVSFDSSVRALGPRELQNIHI